MTTISGANSGGAAGAGEAPALPPSRSASAVRAAPVMMSAMPAGAQVREPVREPARAPERRAGAEAARTVLLVGPDAAGLKARLPEGVAAAYAPTFLEAVLGMGPDVAYEAVFADVRQEVDQLEQAVRSLKKVAPRTKLHLLCDPADEPACRKARGWGADDYHVLPVGKATLERAIGVKKGAAAPHAGAAKGATGAVTLSVAQLPLVIQSVLMSDLLAGRTDFVERAVGTLQGYLGWHGRLRFEAELPADADGGTSARRAVVAHEGTTFGRLTLTGADDADASVLGQAATWLGGWMALAHRNEQLRTLAITDELSGAYNRRYFGRFTASLLERAKAERFRVTVLLFDIDNFKKYNDQYGHAAGDAIIRETIRLLRTCTRPHDLVARLGGDEFAVVFWDNEAPRQPGSQHPKDAVTATERFRAVVASHDWCAGCNIQGSVSISGGLATFPWDGDTVDVLLEKADMALLKAKAQGKNAIVLHESEGE